MASSSWRNGLCMLCFTTVVGLGLHNDDKVTTGDVS